MTELKVKLFADGADLKSMIGEYKRGIVKGFTTNPTLMRKAGVEDYKAFAKAALKAIPDLPLSFEVFTDSLPEMVRQAREISTWGKNVYVKIPVTNTQGISTTSVIEVLSNEKVKLNITAVLTQNQVVKAYLALNKEVPSIISVFAGRIADTGIDPVPTIHFALRMTRTEMCLTEVLWASTREVYNIAQAEQCGCDIITVPPDIMQKLSMFGTDLDQLSLDTVKMFHRDAAEANYKIL